jgi:hypothetical protein
MGYTRVYSIGLYRVLGDRYLHIYGGYEGEKWHGI